VSVCDPPAGPEVGAASKNEQVSSLDHEAPLLTETFTAMEVGRGAPTDPSKVGLGGEIEITEGLGGGGTVPDNGQVIPSISGRLVVSLHGANPP
jgi:hypothetical protein